jgi:hypothetical protein
MFNLSSNISYVILFCYLAMPIRFIKESCFSWRSCVHIQLYLLYHICILISIEFYQCFVLLIFLPDQAMNLINIRLNIINEDLILSD